MFINPDLGTQLACQQQRQVLAEADQHQRHQRDIAARTPGVTTASAAARRLRRLAAAAAAVIGGRLARAARTDQGA